MASLQGVLAGIPGLAGYAAGQEEDRIAQAAQLQQAGGLQALIAKARANQVAEQYRRQMAGATTDAERVAIAAQAAGPEGVLRHADTNARIKANQEQAAARLAQAASQWNASMALKMRGETRADALAALKAQDTTFKQGLARAAAQYNLPQEIVDQFLTTEPMAPAQAPVATPSSPVAAPQVAPQVAPEQVMRTTAPNEAAAMQQFREGGGAPRTVEIAPAAPTPTPSPTPAPSPAPAAKTPPPELEATWARMSPKARDAARAAWLSDQARAGSRAQQVVVKETTEQISKNYERLRDAPQQLANIEKAKALIPQAKLFQGSLGEQKLAVAKFFNNNLGMNIDLEGVKGAEELRSRIFFNVMDNLKKMDAQPSQLQQKVMQDALGQLGTDPGALPKVLDAFADAIRDKVSLYEKQREEAKAIGVNWPHEIKIPPKTVTAPQASNLEGQAKAAWGSYEPEKYEYRVNNGRIQRKAK